jgi:membrane associated rhomboid family serine protease/tetratricopeptide (TPR) repeat protein
VSSEPPSTPAGSGLKLSSAAVTLALTAVNVAVFSIAESHGSTMTPETLMRFGAVSRGAVWGGEWWRLLSYMFLHIGVAHLLINTWVGVRIGLTVEQELGHVEMLLLYVLSGLAGGAAAVLGHDTITAGASGAVFGLIGARFARWRVQTGSVRALLQHPRIRADITFLLIFFLLGPFLGADNYAHAGGLVFGLVFGTALAKGAGAWWPVPLSVLLVVGLAFAAVHPLPLLHDRSVKERAVKDAFEHQNYPRVVQLTEGAHENDLLELRTQALYLLRRFDDAELTANMLVGQSPSDPEFMGMRAQIRDARGDLGGAKEDLDEALKLKKKDARLLALRGEVQWKLGAANAGLADATEAAELAPEDVFTQNVLISVLVRAGDSNGALEACERAQHKNPSSAELEALRGQLLAGLGRTDDALRAADTAAQNDPGSAFTHALRCFVLAAATEPQAAEAECDRAVDLDSSEEVARNIRGWLALQEGQLDSAAEDFAFSLSSHRSSGALAGRGFVAFAHEQWKQAASDADAALALDAFDTEALLLSAEVALQQGDNERAKTQYAKALKLAPPLWYEGRIASDGLKKLVE